MYHVYIHQVLDFCHEPPESISLVKAGQLLKCTFGSGKGMQI